MPSLESSNLIDLFTQIDTAKSTKSKSELLAKAKDVIYNSMSNEQLIDFFGRQDNNFESLFSLSVWTPSLEETQIPEFIEPYDIIERLFSCFDTLFSLFHEFKPQYLFLVNQDKDEKVKHLFVKYLIQLTKNLKPEQFAYFEDINQAILSLESNFKELIPILVKQIPKTTLSYTQLLAELFCAFIHKFDQIELATRDYTVLLSNETTNELDSLSRLNSIIKLRVFELIIKVATCSNERLLTFCESKFSLNERLNEYLNDHRDILSKLNCIEIITDMGVTSHGFEFLHNNGHLKTLYQDLSIENDIFLIPSVVKLFSVIAKNLPEEVNQFYSGYYEYLFKTALNGDVIRDQVSIKLSLETFAYLFGSNEFKAFLLKNYSDKLDQLLERLTCHFKTTINDDLRISSLICVAELISPDPNILNETYDMDTKWQNSDLVRNQTWLNMSELFYSKLISKTSHESLFYIFFTMAKQPFTHIRLAAQLYFKALAQTTWGLTQLFLPNKHNENFLDEYLLNRTIEIEKQGLESKYELVKLIKANFIQNSELHHLIDEHKLMKINAYVRQGAFFAPAQATVATENL